MKRRINLRRFTFRSMEELYIIYGDGQPMAMGKHQLLFCDQFFALKKYSYDQAKEHIKTSLRFRKSNRLAQDVRTQSKKDFTSRDKT